MTRVGVGLAAPKSVYGPKQTEDQRLFVLNKGKKNRHGYKPTGNPR